MNTHLVPHVPTSNGVRIWTPDLKGLAATQWFTPLRHKGILALCVMPVTVIPVGWMHVSVSTVFTVCVFLCEFNAVTEWHDVWLGNPGVSSHLHSLFVVPLLSVFTIDCCFVVFIARQHTVRHVPPFCAGNALTYCRSFFTIP